MPAAIPPPPYTYDDPRFIYDEPCMFYDGGFDEQCLIDIGKVILPKKLGRSTAGRRKIPERKKDCKTILDVKIISALCKVNDEIVDDEEVTKKYHLEYDPITVTVNTIKCAEKDVNVYMQAMTSSVSVPQVCFDPNIKLLPIKTIVSSSLEARMRKSKLLVKSEIVTKKKKKQ
jgi:hypothetical protein